MDQQNIDVATERRRKRRRGIVALLGALSMLTIGAGSMSLAQFTDTTSTTWNFTAGTIDFTNPNSSLPHDVCVQSSSGQQLGCSDQVMGGSTSLNVQNLKPGSYTFYCSVDSHEQAGMKGTLSVK